MSKSTTKQPVWLNSGDHRLLGIAPGTVDRKNSSPDENALAINPTERINTSIAFPTASSSSTMATIDLVFGTWHDR
jgi:hypothetical protein